MLAAYAFVLNALLATSLMAATPASKSLSGFELCIAVSDASNPVEHDDKANKRAAVHCQLCLQHAAAAALPPPSLGLLLNRIAITPDRPLLQQNSVPDRRDVLDHRPRGPPPLT